MSLRYASKAVYEAWMRMKDQTSKCDSAIKLQARRMSSSVESFKVKQAEESLRTVMFLSCWAPN